jgi:hypothetical protein
LPALVTSPSLSGLTLAVGTTPGGRDMTSVGYDSYRDRLS